MGDDSVQRRILEATARGEIAEFERVPAPAVEGSDEAPALVRPEVEGSFIAALWKGVHAGAELTEAGIQIRGLRITGDVELYNTKGVRGGREGLPPIWLQDCEIDGLSFAFARLSDVLLHHCTVANADFEGAQVSGMLSFAGTQFDTRVDISGASVDGDVLFSESEMRRGITFDDAVLNSDLVFNRCRLMGDSDRDGACLRAVGLRVARQLRFDASRCQGHANLESVHAGALTCDRTRFRGPKGVVLDLRNAQIEEELLLFQTVVRGSIDASHSSIGGRARLIQVSLWCNRTDDPAVLLQAARVGKDLTISSSKIANLVLMDARIEQNIWISRCRFPRRGDSLSGHVMATNCQAQEVRISDTVVETALLFNSARISGDFDLRGMTIGCARKPGQLWSGGEDATTLNLAFSTFGFLRIFECLVSGQVLIRDAQVASQMILEKLLVKTTGVWSVLMEGVTSSSLVTFERIAVSAGLAMPGLRCSELQIKGGSYHGFDDGDRMPFAIWATDCQIGRRLQFSMYRPKDGNEEENRKRRIPVQACGRMDFSNSSFEEAVIVRGLEARAGDDADALAEMTVLDLSRCKVRGDVRLFNQRFGNMELDARETPAQLRGCVTIDKAEIDGDVELNGIEIRHMGVVSGKPRTAEAERQITDCKHGVVLSLFRARIKGDLILGRPHLHGIVDLRNATIRMIQDGSGTRWALAHVQPGGLLLDGLRYEDLDHVSDGETSGRRARERDLAARRLEWLKMQFPKRRPDSDRFVAQPYEQLARMFAEEGEDRARRMVQLEKRELRRKYGRVHFAERLLGGILKVTSDYGYSPGRAALWLLLFIAIGAGMAEWLHLHHALVLADSDLRPGTAFDPIVYAIDVAIPVVDLGQDGVFIFSRDALPPWPHAEQILMIGKAVYQLIGLALASIMILTLTGSLREKE